MLVKDSEKIIGHSLIQHGKINDRIYVMDYKHELETYFMNQVHLMAKDFDYGKIIAKIPNEGRNRFLKHGFEMEAAIPHFYQGKDPCYFMAKYYKKARKTVTNKNEIVSIINEVEGYQGEGLDNLADEYKIQVLEEKDTTEMVEIYKKVFKTYPFPVHDERYLRKTMLGETIYFGVFDQEVLVGISSCEMNKAQKNVEMTDFAIVPSYRGQQLSKHLLRNMEQTMTAMGIKSAYTIARSVSLPMNATFSTMGYKYCGTLWNNTQIAGTIESMNVWHKSLYK